MASHSTASESQQDRVGMPRDGPQGPSGSEPQPSSILYDGVKALVSPLSSRPPFPLISATDNHEHQVWSLSPSWTLNQVLTCLLQVEGPTASVQCVLGQSGENYSACS